MKLFLRKILLLFVLMYALDWMAGNCFTYIDNNRGSHRGNKYIFDQVNSQILIFGSSRAYRHYDTRILSDSLGYSAYNCGQSAQCFIHNYVLLDQILKRYTPKLIIYDVNPRVDFIVSNHDIYLSGLRPYHERPSVYEVLTDINPNEKYMTISNLYCFNTICNSMFLYYFNAVDTSKVFNGFVPTNKEMDTFKMIEDKNNFEIDSLKIKYADKFVKRAKDIKLIFVISPRWYGMNKRHVALAKDFAKKNNIPLYDYSNDPRYVHNDLFFYDGTHMNSKGADSFTKELVKDILM